MFGIRFGRTCFPVINGQLIIIDCQRVKFTGPKDISIKSGDFFFSQENEP